MTNSPQTTVRFSRDVEIRHAVDVCVIGGGPAGIAAAVTAARQRRRVALIEGQSCFGGMGTAGGLPIFCSFTDWVNFVAGGIGREIFDRLWDAGGMAPDMSREPPTKDPYYKAEVLKRVYDEMIAGCGAEYTLCAHCIGVEVEDGRITTAICQGKSGLFAITALVFIDATGDGDLCAWAGAPFAKGDERGEMQAGTLCSVWSGIDWPAANAAGHGVWQQDKHLPRAFRDHLFTIEDPALPGMIPIGVEVGGGNIGHTFGVDGTDERSLTTALLWARKLLTEYERFYKEYLTGYEKMELVATAAMLGIRETRRIEGDYILCLDDFHRRAIFADEIGRFAYPVDIHASRPGQEEYEKYFGEFLSLRYGPGESYGIPYRCLTPKGLHNVLVAGRCISTDRYIQGSLRVMPGCFITGQACGMAAALVVEHATDTRGIAVSDLQTRLRNAGAYLPTPVSQ